MPVADTEDHPMSSFTDRARSALSLIEQDEREAGTDQAGALHRLGRDLSTPRAQADGELADLPTGRSSA
jgi:hypothetical protein